MEKAGYRGGFGLANITYADVTTNWPGKKVIFISNGIPPMDGPVEIRNDKKLLKESQNTDKIE